MGDSTKTGARRSRLVLAEDTAAVRRQLEILLSGDFEVVGIAEDGLVLLELARALSPDALVVDIAMPRLNGLEAVGQLRASGDNTPVVFVSVHTEPTLISQATGLGRCGYVIKERAAEELGDAIRALMPPLRTR